MEPTEPTGQGGPSGPDEPGGPGEPPEAARDRRALWIVAGVALVAILVVAAVVLLGGDDDEDVDVVDSTTSTSEPTTSTTEAETTTTTEASTTTTGGTVPDDEAATAVWPDPAGDVRYDDPVDAARGFAEDLVGFTDPVVGQLREGDSRSGEVDVQATGDGPVTTVLVRRFSDDAWYVLGAATEDIVLDDPVAGGAIDDPLVLSGQARAFEGTVQVAVFERGGTEPLGEGFVTAGGGGDLGPFEGEVSWSNPGGGWGSVVLYEISAEDGNVSHAMAIPVGFIGGD
jgi:hypothetical protein